MNPANYQNMAAPGMMAPGLQQQQGVMQRSNASMQVQHLIIRTLQQQQQQHPPTQGWQATVQIMTRALQVFQLVSSLRLIKPDIEIQQCINLAIVYESKVFQGSPDKESYERACKEKLSEIADTRARQATSLQQQMQNSQPPLMNITQQQMQMQGMVPNQSQAQFQPGFGGPQMQQQMQVPAMVMQQQLMQQPQVQMGNSQMNMPQMAQNAHPQMPQQHFTPEENGIINHIAHQLAQNTPRERIEAIRNSMQNMSPEQRQILQMQNADPIAFFFRNQAMKRYAEQRARMNVQRVNQSIAPPGNALMPQQVRPASQNSGPPQGQQATPQMFDQPFAGNMDQILVQQQDAMRSQEAGQVVVPASNGQGIPDQQRGNVRGTPQQQPNSLLGGNHPTHQQPVTQYWSNSHPNMQQNPHIPIPLPASSFGNPPQQQHALQGQIGGLSNHPGRLPPQNPAMPNLNKGLGTSPQTPNMWAQQRPTQSNQPKDQAVSGPQQSTQQQGAAPPEQPEANQQRQRPASNVPPSIQQHFASLNKEQRKQFITQYQHAQRQRQQQQQQQQQGEKVLKGPESEPMQPQKSQNAASIGQQTPQPAANKPVVSNGSQQAPVSQPPAPTVAPGQQNLQPQRIPQQQHPLNLQQNARAAAAAQQVANYTLTEEQTRQMDAFNFPAGILNANSALSQLPENVKTWAQLKSWVAQNDHTLPHGSLLKLRGLQGLHYQNLAAQHKRQNVTMGPSHPMMTQGSTQPSAPTAPMVPPRNNGLPMSLANSSRPVPNVMQPMPQPTIQEIQAARVRLPERLAGMTDNQLATAIMKQRQEEIMKATHAQQKPGQQQNQYNNLQRSHYPPGVQQQFPPSANQPVQAPQPSIVQGPLPPQGSRPTAPLKDTVTKQQNQPSRMSQTPNQGQSSSKGVKRNNSDDVVEVPNPNVGQQDVQPKTQVSTYSRPQAPPNSSDQFQTAPMETKALEAQRRMQAAQRAQSLASQSFNSGVNGQTTEQQRTAEQVKRDVHFKQIMAEVNQATPDRPFVPLEARTKENMAIKLRDAKEMLQRMDQSLPLFFKMFAEEKNIVQLVRTIYGTRLLLQRQYRDTQTLIPAEQFTVSSQELDVLIEKLRKYIEHIMQRLVQSNPPFSGSQLLIPPPQRPKPIEHVLREQTPYLSATNLQVHEKAMQDARQASVQKTHNSNRAPAAPTSPQPPFTFGAQSPQGLAKYPPDKPNGLTQDKLNLPQTKRRKANPVASAGSPPVPPPRAIPSKAPQVGKNTAQGTRPATPQVVMMKCSVPNCQANPQGFATQAELDKHTSEAHESKEPPIEDPLQWACDQMRLSLGLDENGKSAPRKVDVKAEKEVHEAPKMKASTSAQGQSTVKQEASTPMTRVPTQTGPSPASNLLKTPQASANIKTPASEVKSGSKEGKSGEPKPSTDATKSEPSSSPDPWATSLVSSAVITQAWSGLSELQSLGSWTKIENTLTPASTLSSGKSDKNSPRVSDISENDAVKINLAVDNDKDWLPTEWFEDGLYGDMEALNMDQDMLGMDWETAFGTDFVAGSAENGVDGGKAGAVTVDDVQPSPDWLEIYASESMGQTFG